jgi:hypothetical protein
MMQIFFVHTNHKILLRKFKEIWKYKILVMCIFSTPHNYLYVNWILVYNMSNNYTLFYFILEL